MARRVNQIETIFYSVLDMFHLDGVTFYRDPAFFLKFHIIKYLRLHIAPTDGLSNLQKTVGERALPMVDVGNNAKVPDVIHVRKILISLIFLFKPCISISSQRYSNFEFSGSHYSA